MYFKKIIASFFRTLSEKLSTFSHKLWANLSKFVYTCPIKKSSGKFFIEEISVSLDFWVFNWKHLAGLPELHLLFQKENLVENFFLNKIQFNFFIRYSTSRWIILAELPKLVFTCSAEVCEEKVLFGKIWKLCLISHFMRETLHLPVEKVWCVGVCHFYILRFQRSN